MSIIRQGKNTFNTDYPATEVAATTAKSTFMDFLPCPLIKEVGADLSCLQSKGRLCNLLVRF